MNFLAYVQEWGRQRTPQKILFFFDQTYKIEVMMTSLIETLELPNFGHMTESMI